MTEDAPKQRTIIPFRTKLTSLGGLLVVIPLAVLGFLLLGVASETVRRLNWEYRASVAGDLARTIDTELGGAQDGLDALGRVLTNPNLEENASIEFAEDWVAAHETLDHAGIYTAEGDLVDIIREEDAPRVRPPEALSGDIREEAINENVATGEAEPGAQTPRVLIVVPLRSGGTLTGFAASLVSLERVQARVERLTEERFEGLENALFVVDNKMRIVAHPNIERARNLRSMSAQGILEGVDPRAMSGSVSKAGEYVGETGEPMVGTVMGLESRPWAIIAQVPRRVAYGSIDQMRRYLIIVTTIAIIIALLFAFLMARQITRPIQQLSNFAKDLAARRFDRRVTVSTRDELAVLGDAMSNAAADLQASEERIRKEEAIRGDLGRYLPSELVDKVVRREQDMGLGGRRSPVTVLFADVVGFTPLADSLAAEDTVGLLNELFTILTEIVFRHGGTVDKFIGDCVMAIWGAPEPQDDHAQRALAAAEDMMRWLDAGNPGWEQKYGTRVELAIGINSGEAVVGNIGSETRMQYTAIGDVVNVAARLELIARPQQILVTHATKSAAGDAFEYVTLGPRQMVGRHEAVHLFEVRV